MLTRVENCKNLVIKLVNSIEIGIEVLSKFSGEIKILNY